jgi:hypothetical protein
MDFEYKSAPNIKRSGGGGEYCFLLIFDPLRMLSKVYVHNNPQL